MKDINTERLSITSVELIHGYNNAGECEFILDEVQSATVSNTEEKINITGKGGRVLGSLKKNKAVKVTGSNGLVCGGMMAAQTGGEVTKSENMIVRATEILTVASNSTATLTAAPAKTESVRVYIKNNNGTLGTALKAAATETPAAGEYKLSDETITVAADAAGSELVCFYDRTVDTAAKVSNASDSYSKTLTVYMDCLASDPCGDLYRVQFVFPRADFTGNFDLAIGENPAVHSFEFESVAGGCGGRANLWDCIIFGDGE